MRLKTMPESETPRRIREFRSSFVSAFILKFYPKKVEELSMKLSVKTKIIAIIISVSVFGLGIFGYFTFQIFKDDKLAFLYDSLTNETESKSTLFATATEDNGLFLSSIISGIDVKTKNSLESAKAFLNGDQKKIVGLYYHIVEEATLAEQTVFEAKTHPWNWNDIKEAPMGVSIIDKTQGSFLLKKEIGKAGSFGALVFKQNDLWNILSSRQGRMNFMINKNVLIAKDKVLIETTDLLSLKDRMLQSPGSSGLFEMNVIGENYFVTFSKLGANDLFLVNMIPSKKVLAVQDLLLRQIVGFLALMVFVCLFIGTIAARWLTWHLDGLTHAARELEAENFDVQVDVTSTDELGTLGTAFNQMGIKIKGLLEELRIYNLELEKKVADRTKELQSLTDIQNGMLNALGQGFVIIDKNHKILPIYSKVAEDMFDVVPDQAAPREIMAVDEVQGDAFKEFFELYFASAIGFDDMARIAPDLRTNTHNQRIQLSYAPIANRDTQEADYVLVIGTDKTAEYENMEKFNKEWNHSQMIQKMASNRLSLNKIITESMNMLNTCIEELLEDKPYSARTVQRLIHTIKGSFSYFYISEVTKLCHDLETDLGVFYNAVKLPEGQQQVLVDRVLAVLVSLECFVEHYDSIIQYREATTTKSAPAAAFKEFAQLLRARAPELEEDFTRRFFSTEVGSYFQMYPTIVRDLCASLSKDVRFNIVGKATKIPEGPWDEIFQQFIHFVRNSMDHGIETPEARVEAGKAPQGQITFEFSLGKKNGEEVLNVSLSDDGAGVHWEKIAAKDPSVTSLEDALERIKTGGISSKDEVSETSGRGVGVSSLFSALNKFGGTSTFESFRGQGMRITIALPLASVRTRTLKIAA
jgi:two-component system chemotaxis sensor kinase CheA